MERIDIDTADRAFVATRRNPRENHASFFVMGLMLATILVPFLFTLELDSFEGRVIIVAPWALMFVLLMLSWRRARRHRHVTAAISAAWDHAQLEDWAAVEAILPHLLRHPIRSDSDRGRTMVLLASVAERKRCYDAAAHIYERLLRERIGDAPLLQQAQLALASAKLRNEELTDAVDLLDRLQQIQMPASLRAVYEVIRLHQQVFMGHYADAIANIDDRIALFRRHLSTRAGFAYALVAAAFHRLNMPDRARRYWNDATMLVTPNKILERFEIARDVSQAYPAAEHPL
ncbi:MAG: hypothetical protein KDA33_17750 [Phycisphaerales bacterium]|nr:hypothetical protein [Phycisphaerales bacterium]